MIRVPEDKAVEILVNYQQFNDAGYFMTEDEVWFRVNEEQYNRIKNSYESGKYKTMSEDEALSDLCTLIEKEIRKAKSHVFHLEFPEDIKNGITFEENSSAQWDHEQFNELINAVFTPGIDPETQAEIDKLADEAYEAACRFADLEPEIDALDKWMRSKGFEYGRKDFALNDENDYFVGSLDIAWPEGVYGLRRGFTKPVGLRIDADNEFVKAAEELGYTCLTSIEAFKAYIEENYLKR